VQNRFQHAVERVIDFVIPEAHYTVAGTGEKLVSRLIAFGILFISMLTTIHFNDEPASSAFEVDVIWR
jgi:hypothetical protein